MGTTTVLWGAVALAADAERVELSRFRRHGLLVANLVNPPVTEVILVIKELVVLLAKEKSQRNFGREVMLIVESFESSKMSPPIDSEPMEVGILPAHHYLDNLVQLGQVDGVLHLYPAPDQRAYVHQRNFQLINVHCCGDVSGFERTIWA